MFFKLDCGRSVMLDAFYYQRTYLALMEGRPDRWMHNRILDKVRTEMSALWGKRTVHIIPPSVDESDRAHPVLPPVRFTAWLTCNDGIRNNPYGGSQLVVVWFREECGDEPLDKVIGDGIRSLPWDDIAEDFDY